MPSIQPDMPIFWHAQYPKDHAIRIPRCPSCQVFTHSYIAHQHHTCRNCGSSEQPSFDDAWALPSENGLVYEYDSQGQQVCKWHHLPLDDMLFFGLINTVRNEVYGIDLQDGTWILRNLQSEHSMQMGMAVPRAYETRYGSIFTHTLMSDPHKIEKSNIYLQKSASSGGSQSFLEFFLGYFIDMDDIAMRFLCGITIDTVNFMPKMGLRTIDSEENGQSKIHHWK